MEREHNIFTFISIFFSNERANPKAKESSLCGLIWNKIEQHHDNTNKMTCAAQQRWASAQSDQSLRCALSV